MQPFKPVLLEAVGVPDGNTLASYKSRGGYTPLEQTLAGRQPADVVERRVRAFDPFPVASFSLDSEVVKLWRAALRPELAGAPGQVLAAADGRLTVACGVGALDLLQLQRPGGRRIDTAAFLQARPGLAGRMLGG